MPKVNMITGEEAVKEYDGKNLQQLLTEVEKLGRVSGGIQQHLMGMAFAVGHAYRKAKAIPKAPFDTYYDQFVNTHYAMAGKKMPSPDSITGYKSWYGAFAKAGMKTDWDAAPLVKAAIDVRDVTLSWKAGKINEALKLEKEPSPADIKKLLTPKVGSGGGSRTSGRNVDGILKGIINRTDKIANDKRFMKAVPEMSSVRVEALRSIFDGVQALRDTFIDKATETTKPKLRKAQEKFVAAVKASLPARPRSARAN